MQLLESPMIILIVVAIILGCIILPSLFAAIKWTHDKLDVFFVRRKHAKVQRPDKAGLRRRRPQSDLARHPTGSELDRLLKIWEELA